MKFTKKDLFSAVTTGLTTGVIVWKIFEYLEIGTVYGFSWMYLILVIPVFWILGVSLGYTLGRFISFFSQFGKFVAIGFTNAAVDFGVLNLLLSTAGVTSGIYYPIFKGCSFVAGLIHSYFWNKYWAFEATDTSGGGGEFAKFAGVAVVSALVNIAVASSVVNFVDPLFGMNDKVWANFGAVVGSAVALVLSFVGFKLAVFKVKSINKTKI